MANQADELTPMLRQYRDVKRSLDKDVFLMFRLGDFYELFMDDAREVAPLLGLALTHRAGQPMCGIPHHAIDQYLARLIKIGRKIAICDQMEDPKSAKGRIVRREVTRVVTPGTLTEEELLSDTSCNYLVAAVPDPKSEGYTLGVLELSTGELFCEKPASGAELSAALSRLGASEALVAECFEPGTKADAFASLEKIFVGAGIHCITKVDEYYFDPLSSREYLLRHFAVASLDGFGCEGDSGVAAVAGALLRRVADDLRRDISHIRSLRLRSSAGFLSLDPTTARHLNLFPSSDPANKGASLFEVLDATRTSMGKRLLQAWIARPLFDKDAIYERLDAVSAFTDRRACLTPLGSALSRVGDLKRMISRVAQRRASARDLLNIATSLSSIPEVKAQLESPITLSTLLRNLHDALDPIPELSGRILATISDEPPASIADGGVIRSGFCKELDELRSAQSGGKEWIISYQQSEIVRTGIKNLKVRYNRVFGYFLEVSTSQLSLVPENYIRKQTIAGGERFTTPELKEREQLIAGAEEKALALEQQIFAQLCEETALHTQRIQTVADALAQIDVLCSFADRALALGYTRPQIDEGDTIDIRGGRHAIIEQLPDAERFVPNDTLLNCTDRQIMVITGPNMAGKSTYIRQVALLSIMAQIGSFLPADSARIGLVDRVFTRVGASDDLARGRSTFLVEMQETANILNNATPRSLIVLDEIGRGTSTFDGISIAWAVAEYLHNTATVKAKTLFATHYHELTDLALTMRGVVNCSVLVRERGEGIVFLRRIVEGPADKSYGIAVAKLAGMPEAVLTRARQILTNLESDEISETTGQPTIVEPHNATARRKSRNANYDDRQMYLF